MENGHSFDLLQRSVEERRRHDYLLSHGLVVREVVPGESDSVLILCFLKVHFNYIQSVTLLETGLSCSDELYTSKWSHLLLSSAKDVPTSAVRREYTSDVLSRLVGSTIKAL